LGCISYNLFNLLIQKTNVPYFNHPFTICHIILCFRLGQRLDNKMFFWAITFFRCQNTNTASKGRGPWNE
jgi:hypothetical protein